MRDGARRRLSAWLAALTGASALLFGLVACAEDPSVSHGPYAAQFEQARGRVSTDFQRDVLRDDVITDEEFREVRQRYVDCLAGAGIRAVALEDGSYDVYADMSGANGDTEKKCADETTASIEALYNEIHVNPQNQDFSALIATCLQKQGVVGSGFTKKDWDDYVTVFSAAARAEPEGTTRQSNADLPRLPGGAPKDDPRVLQCSDNPLGL